MRSTTQKREVSGDLQFCVKARHCEVPRDAAAISIGLLRCARNDTGVSGKDTMDKPVRRLILTMETRPEQPEAPPLLVLDPVIIADGILGSRPFGSPPFVGDPLRSIGPRD